MNKIAKIAVLSLGGIFLSWIFILIFYDYPQDSFSNIKIPKDLDFEKPIESLTNKQIDSLENKIVNEEEILVTGNGYNGYEFYVWYKPTELGIKVLLKNYIVHKDNSRLREAVYIHIEHLIGEKIFANELSFIDIDQLKKEDQNSDCLIEMYNLWFFINSFK